ncbi:MAG: pyridoxamine 5'-phosphate oxidase family protein [Methylophilaceae bacterium]
MGQRYTELSQDLIQFIRNQHIFFVATAPAEGRVNLSPKGMDSLRVIDPSTVAWLDVTGSGNETAAHVLENGRMTIMYCAFEGKPVVLRLYGQAKVYHARDAEWGELAQRFEMIPGARQIFVLDIDLVLTSCGMGVPYLEYKDERHQLDKWAEKKGEQGIFEYWEKRNQLSLDGKPTGIFEDSQAV